MKTIVRKPASAIVTVAFAVSLCIPGLAFAADSENDAARDEAAVKIEKALVAGDDVDSGAATRAASPSLEILGINSVEESGQFVTMTNGVPQYNWEQPKYYLAASKYNSDPSTYLVNLAKSLGTEAVYNSSRNGGGAGPDSALQIDGSDTTDAAVLAMNPTVIVGNASGNVSYQSTLGYSYEPGVTYSCSSYSDLINTMNNIASVADNGRYGSTSAIAAQYANYINNTLAYVKSHMNDEGIGERTIALVTDVTQDSEGHNVYTIQESGSGSDGTASSNRYLETVENVSYNYADDAEDATAVSASELAANVDLILVGGQQSSSNYGAIVTALEADTLLSDTFFVEDNGSHGAMYGTIMNSVENAQNIGRILGCLYPELIDQDAFMVYYYVNFYHINESDVAYVMSQAMDGVRNWDATGTTEDELTDWTIADCTISEADMNIVEDIIDDGVLNESYLESDN